MMITMKNTYLISIPRPATSVATRISLAPDLRLDKANSLKIDKILQFTQVC